MAEIDNRDGRKSLAVLKLPSPHSLNENGMLTESTQAYKACYKMVSAYSRCRRVPTLPIP